MPLTDQEIDKVVKEEMPGILEKFNNLLAEFAAKEAAERKRADAEAKKRAREYFAGKE